MKEVNHMDGNTILNIFAIVIASITSLSISFAIGYMIGSDD